MPSIKTILFFSSSLLIASCNNHIYKEKVPMHQTVCTVSPSNFKTELSASEYCDVFRIKVKVNNKTFNFAIMTGYENSVLTKKAAKELNVAKNANVVSLQDVVLENIHFSEILLKVENIHSNLTCCDEEIHGIIGSDIMSKVAWQFDYPKKRLFIASHVDSFQLPIDKYVIPFKTKNKGFGMPSIQLMLNQNLLSDVYISTGYLGGICLPKTNIDLIADTARYIVEYNAVFNEFDGFEKRINKNVNVKHLSLGNTMPLKDVVLGSHYFDEDSYMGTHFLSNYVVTFDWKNQNVIFSNQKPYKESKAMGFNYYYSGLKKIIIHTVYKNSPAYNAGIEIGDEVISAEEVDLSKFTKQQYLDWWRQVSLSNKEFKYYRIKKGKSTEQIYLNPVDMNTLWRIKKK